MKQTAVEFLIKEFSEILGKIKTQPMEDLLLVDAINKAKEMEKQQIIDAYDEGYGTRDAFGDVTENNTGEQHYTETYGK